MDALKKGYLRSIMILIFLVSICINLADRKNPDEPDKYAHT